VAQIQNIGEAIAGDVCLHATLDGRDPRTTPSISIGKMEKDRFEFVVPEDWTKDGGRNLLENVRVWLEDRASGETFEVYP
jgi:hypothetical protein